MRILTGTALALLLAFGSARAEEALSPERVALAKEVMALSGATKVYDNYDKYFDLMMTQIRQAHPAVDDATAAELKKIAVEEFNASKPQMLEGAANIYARHFSEDDLKALIAFYKTPAGQHFITELPAVANDSVALTGPFMMRIMDRVKKYVASKVAGPNASENPKTSESKDKKDK